MKFKRIALAIFGIGNLSMAHAQNTQPWQPTSASWSCSERATGERLCTLVVRGSLAQSPVTNPTQASASYRVVKSSAIAPDIALLSGIANMACQTTANEVFCVAENEVRLEPGIVPTFTGEAIATQFKVATETPYRLFDWNGDGQLSSAAEGLLLVRYLLGFRGNALSQDVTFTNGTSPATVENAIASGVVNDWFRFNAASSGVTGVREGLAFMRCIFGLTGEPLTSGIYASGSATEAESQCNRIYAIAR